MLFSYLASEINYSFYLTDGKVGTMRLQSRVVTEFGCKAWNLVFSVFDYMQFCVFNAWLQL